MGKTNEVLPWTGLIAVGVTIGCIHLAAILSPAFAWQENALSHLGVTTTEAGTATTAVLFNGGLVLGGVIGLLFCIALYRTAITAGAKLVAGLLAVTLALMGLVGVFPTGTRLHYPVAFGFFLMITISLWVDGAVWARRGDRQGTLLSGGAGTVHIGMWVAWIQAGTPWGLAVPEITGAFIFGAWVCLRSVRLARTL